MAFDKAIELSIDEAESFFLDIGFNLNQEGYYNEAIYYLSYATIQYEDNENILFELAYAYDKADQIDDGIETYLILLELNPYFENAWYNLGILYNKKGEFTKWRSRLPARQRYPRRPWAQRPAQLPCPRHNSASTGSSSDSTCCSTRVRLAWAVTRSVMARAKASRSTARALPAGTRWPASSIKSLPRARISALSRPTPEVSSSERRELEHTSLSQVITDMGSRPVGGLLFKQGYGVTGAPDGGAFTPAAPPPTTAMDMVCIHSPAAQLERNPAVGKGWPQQLANYS